MENKDVSKKHTYITRFTKDIRIVWCVYKIQLVVSWMEAFSRLNFRGECMLINTKRFAWIRASAAEGESLELFCTSHTPATSACEMDSSMECLLRHFKAVEWHCCVSQFACAIDKEDGKVGMKRTAVRLWRRFVCTAQLVARMGIRRLQYSLSRHAPFGEHIVNIKWLPRIRALDSHVLQSNVFRCDSDVYGGQKKSGLRRTTYETSTDETNLPCHNVSMWNPWHLKFQLNKIIMRFNNLCVICVESTLSTRLTHDGFICSISHQSPWCKFIRCWNFVAICRVEAHESN